MHREPEVPETRVFSGRMFRLPWKGYLKGTCTNPFCEKWHLPECLFYKSENGCRFGESARMHIVRLMNSVAKGPKNGDKKCSGFVENYTTVGLRKLRYGAAEVYNDFTEELKHTEANPMCSIH